MKQPHRLAFLAAFVALAVLGVACGGGVGSHGWAAPVASGNQVLITTSKGKLTAISASSRERVWQFPQCWNIPTKDARKLSGIYGAPVVSSDGRAVFVGDYNGYVYAFNPSQPVCTGGEKPNAASVKLDGSVIGGLALEGDDLFVSSGRHLYRVDADALVSRISDSGSGVTTQLLFSADDNIWGAPVINSDRVLVASLDGNLYALSTSDGSETWRYTAGGGLASTPLINSGLALVGGFDGKLHAVDLSSGDERWTAKADNWVWNSGFVDGSRAYFGDFSGKLHAVDVSNGNILWSTDLKRGVIRGAPVLARGTLVVATQEGWLVGLDPSNQSERWATRVGSALNADLVLSGSDVFIAPYGCVTPEGTDEKAYYVGVDPASGELRRAGGIC